MEVTGSLLWEWMAVPSVKVYLKGGLALLQLVSLAELERGRDRKRKRKWLG